MKTLLSTCVTMVESGAAMAISTRCYSLTTFADSLVALAYGFGWIMQPPIVDLRNAIVVDFQSDTESHAESSIAHGWNGAFELPMGAVSTVFGRRETNEQNAFIERHLLFLRTAMTMGDFHRQVVEKLLDSHSCREPDCSICQLRFSRGLDEAFQIFGDRDGSGRSSSVLKAAAEPEAASATATRQHRAELAPSFRDPVG